MKSLLSFLLFSSLFLICYSAVFLQPQRAVPGYEGMCYDEEENIFYKKGEKMKWKVKGCAAKICKGFLKKGYTHAEIQTCGAILAPPGCRVGVDLRLAYPKCCGRIICPEDLFSNKKVTRDFA